MANKSRILNHAHALFLLVLLFSHFKLRAEGAVRGSILIGLRHPTTIIISARQFDSLVDLLLTKFESDTSKKKWMIFIAPKSM